MSEIGTLRVRPRLFCRMISCPATKGIICSICRPSATEAPSGTRSAMASRMVRSLDMAVLFPLPNRRTLFEEGADTLVNIFRLQQLLEIYLLRPRQPFVEVHRVPGVVGLLGNRQHGRAQLRKLLYRILHRSLNFGISHSAVGQTDARRFHTRNAAPGKD